MNVLQKQAVEAPDGYVQIVAGPGTGKTVTIVGRVMELIKRGVEQNTIVVLSFTRAAAREIKQRVSLKLGTDCKIIIGTFHSVAYRLLRRYGGPEFNNLSIMDDNEKKEILQTIVEDRSQLKYYLHQISRIQVFGEVPEDSNALQVYRKYTAIARGCNRVDYDGLLTLFKNFLERSTKIQEIIGAVLVDEFQDTSALQLKIAVSLTSKCRNLTVVGDPDQSIYAFRNAEPRNFELMLSMVPKKLTHMRHLEQNYRSEQQILDEANRVISNRNISRYAPQRRLVAVSESSSGDSSCPSLVRYLKSSSKDDEAAHVVKHISSLLKCGVKPNEICVLSRKSRNYRYLETQFLNHGINVRMVGGQGTLMRPEIRAIIDYIRVALDEKDQLAIMRTVNYPPRKLGAATLKRVCSLEENNLPTMLRIRSQPPTSPFSTYTNIIDKLTSILGENKGLKELKNVISYLHTTLFKEATASDLLDVADQFAAFMEEEGDPDDDRSFAAKFVSLWALQTGHSDSHEQSKDSVTLSTIHSAKGLEWPVVFLIGAENFRDTSSDTNESEESRLLYVALTRAKCYLVVTSPSMSFDQRLAINDEDKIFLDLPSEFNIEVLSRCLGRPIQRPKSPYHISHAGKDPKSDLNRPTRLGKAIELTEGFMLASDLPMQLDKPHSKLVDENSINSKKRRMHTVPDVPKGRSRTALKPPKHTLLSYFNRSQQPKY